MLLLNESHVQSCKSNNIFAWFDFCGNPTSENINLINTATGKNVTYIFTFNTAWRMDTNVHPELRDLAALHQNKAVAIKLHVEKLAEQLGLTVIWCFDYVANYAPMISVCLSNDVNVIADKSLQIHSVDNSRKNRITQLTSNSGAAKTQMLITNMNHYIDMIRSVTGLNEARDGSTPDPNALVGVQKLAALSSNTATRHILDSSLFIYRSLAEAITYRVGDILEYSDFKDEFINQIGKYNVSILNEINDLYIYDFGIFIEVSPDEEQKAQLEANIQMALSKGDINLEDAIDIREIRNLKLANQLLKVKRVRNQEREEKMAMQKQSIIAQQQLKSQEMASQAAMQKIEMETNSKMQIKQAEVAFEIQKLEKEAEMKALLMREEFQYNMQLQGIEVGNLTEREKMKEDAKAKRISQQNTEQSKLINQRKNNLPPMNFESNEDSLDGFDMAEFEPR